MSTGHPEATVVLSLLAALLAAPCAEVLIDASVADDLRSVRGVVTCAGGDGATAVATYPRLLREPVALDDINREWHYPNGFEPGELELRAAGAALQGEGAWQGLPAGVRAVEFVTTVPERHGAFGRHQGALFLLGGWHPAFGTTGQPLPRANLRYRLSVPADRVGFVGSTPIGRGARRTVEGRFTGRFLPLLLAPGLEVERLPGAVVLSVAPRRGRAGDDPSWRLRDIMAGRDDTARLELAATLEEGAELAAREGLNGATPLVVVRAHLEERLTESFDGGLVVAERAFHLLGFERFLKFHRIAVWRAQLRALAVPHAARRETSLPPMLAADALAAALVEEHVLARYGAEEYAPDLLESFAVIPEIDALIYAPQIPFVDAYYEAIDESPRARLSLDDFEHDLPRGKLLYEKLVDRIGRVEALRRHRDWLRGDRDYLAAIAEPSLSTWLGPYPRVDYRLGRIDSEASRVVVEVGLSGPDAARVQEPVTVEIEDASGRVHRATREGPGEVSFAAPGPPARVELDPDGRLVELHHDEGYGPRFNNSDPARWRFLLNNVTGLVSLTGGEVVVSADFSLRRIQDLQWSWNFLALYSTSSLAGGATLSYAFGPEITPLRLAHHVGLAGAYERLRTEDGASLPGDQGSITAFYVYDDRVSPFWSYEGKGIALRAVGAYGADTAGTRYRFIQAGASAFYILPLAFGHALLGRARGDLQLGEAPPQNGLRLGGRYRGARGFESDEVRGEQRVLLSAEYRYVLDADARTDFWGLLTTTRIEGALFADAVYLPSRDGDCARQTFYDVGFGLRFMADLLNVSPSTLQIDLGVPFGRCDDAGRSPVTIYAALLQSFSTF